MGSFECNHIPLSECDFGSRCICRQGSIVTASGDACAQLVTSVGDSCREDPRQCDGLAGSECKDDGSCRCKTDYVEGSGKCYPLRRDLHSPCEYDAINTQCYTVGSYCSPFNSGSKYSCECGLGQSVVSLDGKRCLRVSIKI